MHIAIIPARGGSKRIPRKNIKEFCGKPMIAYAIEAAQKSKLFDRIIVSTDDEEIALIARSHGAEVPFLRPASLSDDYTGTTAVVAHALQMLTKKNIHPEFACCIYATVPFLTADSLIQGYEALLKSSAEFVFSVTTFPYPIFRALKRSDAGVEMVWPEFSATRSQDLIETYHDAGQFYWGKSASWLEQKKIFAHYSTPVILPRHLVQDIDTPEDWIRAELMYKALHL
jgi:pseudaminic acid cytidylyltransferase